MLAKWLCPFFLLSNQGKDNLTVTGWAGAKVAMNCLLTFYPQYLLTLRLNIKYF